MKRTKHWNIKELLAGIALASVLTLSGCGGDDGKDGAAGAAGATGADGVTGPAGPSSPLGTLFTTEEMSSNIINASFAEDGTLTVNFEVLDDRGNRYIDVNRLRTSDGGLRFTAAQLQPADATTGDSTFWTRQAYDYVYPNTRAGTDNSANLVLNNDGTYTYTFAAKAGDYTNDEAITYQADYTHRVAFQIGRRDTDFAVMNGSYDWQPSTGNTEGITTRNMVVEESCNNCHGELEMHGAGKVDTAYCVTCHNPDLKDNPDTEWNDTADFKVMIHKLHRGANLPSVVAGGEYNFGESHDYSNTQLPQDIRNCTICHDDNNEATPDAINWINAPSIAACGSCHDNVDFATIQSDENPNGHPGGAVNDNAECALCHAKGRAWDTEMKHLGLMNKKEDFRAAFVFTPSNVVVNQTNGDISVDVNITFNGEPVTELRDAATGLVDSTEAAYLGKYKYGTDNGSLAINWDNGDGYQINHKEIDFNDCTPDGLGKYTCTSPGHVAGITDADMITIVPVDVFICVNEIDQNIERCDAPADKHTRVIQSALYAPSSYFMGDGTPTTESYTKIGADMESCQDCHGDNIFHHGATDLVQCKTCHNATRTSGSRGTGDLKRHVHYKHSQLAVNNIDEEGVPADDYDELINELPVNVDNCTACHSEGQFDLPLMQNSRPSAFAGDLWTSPTAVVCASCHISLRNLGKINTSLPGLIDPADGSITAKQQATLDHMIQNGAVFNGTEAQATKVESCAVCHAVGGPNAVDKVHDLK